jgi:hypothetical protein
MTGKIFGKMPENDRRFQAGPDPFGRTWEVEFRWLQNGISIRHSDTIDAKFVVWPAGDGGAADRNDKSEKIIALPHTLVLALAAKTGHSVTDGWCLKLAARHLRSIIGSGDDLEKTIVTVSAPELDQAAGVWQHA